MLTDNVSRTFRSAPRSSFATLPSWSRSSPAFSAVKGQVYPRTVAVNVLSNCGTAGTVKDVESDRDQTLERSRTTTSSTSDSTHASRPKARLILKPYPSPQNLMPRHVVKHRVFHDNGLGDCTHNPHHALHYSCHTFVPTPSVKLRSRLMLSHPIKAIKWVCSALVSLDIFNLSYDEYR